MESIDWIKLDTIVHKKSFYNTMILRVNEATMEDSIINPFSTFTDEIIYI